MLAAAPLDTGALRSSQASWLLSSLAAALVPSSWLTSTRRSTRAGYKVLRLARPAVRRMLAERHHEDNQGVPVFLLRASLSVSSGLC